MAPIDSPRPSDILLRNGKQSPQHSQHRKGGLDPCKVLDPKRKTLQSLDAERIMTVFQEAVKRLEITTVLPKVLETLPRFSVVLGQELMTHMERHLRLQDRFTEVTSDLNTLVQPQKDESNQPELEQLREDMLKHRATIIAQGIKNSLRDILRCFKKNPKSTEAILSTFYIVLVSLKLHDLEEKIPGCRVIVGSMKFVRRKLTVSNLRFKEVQFDFVNK